jgi:hypothetical protein
MKKFVATLGLVALGSWPGVGHAGALAPTRPSQIVTVVTGGSTCAGTGDSRLDTLDNPDGSAVAFTIPVCKVFVITEAQARGDAGAPFGSAGHNGQVFLYRNGLSSRSSITVDIGTLGSFGTSRPAFSAPPHVFSTGVVVKGGTDVCVNALDLTTQTTITGNAVLHGYFASDK